MLNKYWDLKNIAITTQEMEDDDLIAYGATCPTKPGDPQMA